MTVRSPSTPSAGTSSSNNSSQGISKSLLQFVKAVKTSGTITPAMSQWKENILPISKVAIGCSPCGMGKIPSDEKGSKMHLQTKKREAELRECEEFEKLGDKKNARKIYE